MQNSYDQVPYPSLSYAQTHPDCLATLARLLGLECAPVERCKVLELGCASGGNVIPMAYNLPHSQFVGLDLSARQIQQGQVIVKHLGLENVTLLNMNIMEVTPDLGTFDYIIAHGIYSWVPQSVQDALLTVCRRNLAANGVAYVSYNAYPGWHMMGIIRDAMLYHTRNCEDPQIRAAQARAILDFLATATPGNNKPYTNFLQAYVRFLQGELKGSGAKGDAFLLHDELEDVNTPVYFYQFVEHASQHGLQYLTETDFSSVLPDKLSADAQQALQQMAHTLIEMEQYMDFLRNRMFRKTLLCHAEAAPNRTVKPERMRQFHIASRATPVSETADIYGKSVEKFKGLDDATLSIDHPLSKAALMVLRDNWPQALPFNTLFDAARDYLAAGGNTAPISEDQDAYVLAATLLQAYGYSPELLELHTYTPAIMTLDINGTPLASPIARLQAEESATVTNLWHKRITLDSFKHYLLRQLDSTRDHATLLKELSELAVEGVLELKTNAGDIVHDEAQIQETLDKDLDLHLNDLARYALLVGEP